jgi:transcription initiation factor IIF auxiliary subunit
MERRALGVVLRLPVVYGNVSWPKEDVPQGRKVATHDWCLYIRPQDPLEEDTFLGLIEKVVFVLDKSFGPDHRREVSKPPFETWAAGWGDNMAEIELHFRPGFGLKHMTLEHFVRLYPKDYIVPPLRAVVHEEKIKVKSSHTVSKLKKGQAPTDQNSFPNSNPTPTSPEKKVREGSSLTQTGMSIAPANPEALMLLPIVVNEFSDVLLFVSPTAELLSYLTATPQSHSNKTGVGVISNRVADELRRHYAELAHKSEPTAHERQSQALNATLNDLRGEEGELRRMLASTYHQLSQESNEFEQELEQLKNLVERLKRKRSRVDE